MSKIGRHIRRHRDDYPPEQPPVYGCLTFAEFKAQAAWDLKHQAMHGEFEHTEAAFVWILGLGGDMAFDADTLSECAATLLGFPRHSRIVLDCQSELTARGVDVPALYTETAPVRLFHEQLAAGTLMDDIVRTWNEAGDD